jgi:hypothetical protein
MGVAASVNSGGSTSHSPRVRSAQLSFSDRPPGGTKAKTQRVRYRTVKKVPPFSGHQVQEATEVGPRRPQKVELVRMVQQHEQSHRSDEMFKQQGDQENASACDMERLGINDGDREGREHEDGKNVGVNA